MTDETDGRKTALFKRYLTEYGRQLDEASQAEKAEKEQAEFEAARPAFRCTPR